MTLEAQHQPRRFTVEEYARMGEAGIFPPGERVELIEGEILAPSPQNPKHARRIARLTSLLVRLFGETHEIRVQLPLTLSKFSEPEPDFALVSLQESDDAQRHPSGADLVLEIAESSLSFDRNEKASVYAKAGIQDYWVLNLVNKRLEVRRGPRERPSSNYGWDYADLSLLAREQTVSPLAFPEVQFKIADLLGDA